MADQNEFKHISVSDEDDDLVIEAGARRSGAHAASNPAPRAQRPAPAAEPAPSETCDDAQPVIDASAFPGGVTPANEEEARALQDHLARKKAREAANSLVTTEEDLHSKGPFRSMQLVIIAIAIVLVVVGVAYIALSQ